MSAPPVLTVLKGGRRRPSAPGRTRPIPPGSWNFDNVDAIEIVAPDQYCATLLLDYAAPHFPAEIVPGPGWTVRFQPPATGRDWVIELLTLIETWLRSAPLPCAKVIHGDRHYLVRAPSNFIHTPATPWEAA